MNKIISITEFAKLRNVTTETLRHYDRIGLLKPDCKKNGIRYYSILQYEKLGTIRELQQLGLSLSEIQQYFQNRNLEQTYKLLVEKHSELIQKIEELKRLQQTVEKKIEFINTLKNTVVTDEITKKVIPKRRFAYMDLYIHDDTELSYSAAELERTISKDSYLPIFATNRYAGIISETDFQEEDPVARIAIQVDEDTNLENTIVIPEQMYICTYNIGGFFERKEPLDRIKKYLSEHDYEIAGEVIQMSWVDYAISDYEMSYEFQVPVRKVQQV